MFGWIPDGAARRALRALAIAGAAISGVVLAAGALFALAVYSRRPLQPVLSTTHASLARRRCMECHAPIAGEWRQSYHYRSLTGPYWKDVRDLGYGKIFDRTRKACVNCHAPANVLDLAVASGAPPVPDGSLGVECTPNLLREPSGEIPEARADDTDLGVDCTSCHVDRRGVVGAGRRAVVAHSVVADRRFQDPATTSVTLCRACHGATVRAWLKSGFAARGVTCLDCHMPPTEAASTDGGPPRSRRSHRFPGDKDRSLLEGAVNASLEITARREARFRIRNDRVGHFFPSGGNWLSVRFRVLDPSGRGVEERVELFGKEEPLLLDFWPFNADRRIASGEEREILFPLPDGHGLVDIVVRYHDWMKTRVTVATLQERF
jgi:hypothetical protein